MTQPIPEAASDTAGRATLRQMVAFLKAKLVKQASLGPAGAFPALSETAERFNDTAWFWTDDNAKAAELLCEPAFYDEDPATADAAIDFVLRMSPGAVIQRRCAPPELRVLSTDPKAFRVETAFFILEGDLSRGTLRHALRFNDGRTVAAARHGGNKLAFRHAGRMVELDVEDAITAFGVRQPDDRTIELSHASALRKPPGWRFGGPAELGRLTYRYVVSADRPSVSLEVTLDPAPGTTLRDVAVTTALDELGNVPEVDYRTLAVRAGGEDRFLRAAPSRRATPLHRGPAEYWAVVQDGASPGFSYAMHVLPHDGAKLAGIQAEAGKLRRLRRVRCRYALGTVSGAPAALREERMLTGGGYYDALAHYAGVLRDDPGSGSFGGPAGGIGGPAGGTGGHADPSMSYDIGAELNAVAAHILFARTGQYRSPPSPGRLDALTAWYDRHAQRYFHFIRPGAPDDLDRVFTRGLAFVVLSLDCMLRATGDARYHAMLDAGVDLILRTQRREARGSGASDVTFADTWAGLMPYLDNHAACILALARAAWHGDPAGALARAIHEGVLGIRLYTGPVSPGGGRFEPYDGLAVLNVPERAIMHADTGYWNFKLGLVLRALHAVRRAAEAGVIPMDETERQRVALRLGVALDRLAHSTRRHGDGTVEVLTSRDAGETNSETQPWVALGLVPVLDEQVVRLGNRAACPPRAEAA